ncbi:hypothetical protein FACS1894133_7160 [Clostridia bacterium]|nr:hypothetical protein FACS1894133_7160 [Clostridia bacterium]
MNYVPFKLPPAVQVFCDLLMIIAAVITVVQTVQYFKNKDNDVSL